MPREDYEKFLQIAPKELEGTDIGVVDYDHRIKNLHAYLFIKIDGISWPIIDLMPLDGVFSSPAIRKIHLWLCERIAIASWHAQRQDKNKKNTMIRYLRLKITTLIFGNYIANKTMHLIRSIKKYDNSCYVQGFGYSISKEIMPKAWFGNGVEKDFLFAEEQEKFCCPNNSHAYLAQIYGSDYMQLPPKRERCGHHCLEDLKIFDKNP